MILLQDGVDLSHGIVFGHALNFVIWAFNIASSEVFGKISTFLAFKQNRSQRSKDRSKVPVWGVYTNIAYYARSAPQQIKLFLHSFQCSHDDAGMVLSLTSELAIHRYA